MERTTVFLGNDKDSRVFYKHLWFFFFFNFLARHEKSTKTVDDY